MATMRLFPPIPPAPLTIVANGRTYTTTAGVFLDVPDFDAGILVANGWTDAESDGVGTTAQRPNPPRKGMNYVDTTISKAITYDGLNWRDVVAGTVV
jgi:hypothetical protein